MPRYIVIEVPDNKEADAIVDSIGRGVLWYTVPTPPDVLDPEGGFAVRQASNVTTVGMYMKPTQFCECEIKGEPLSSRGSKFGIWVHVGCGKPRKGTSQTPNDLITGERPSERPVMVTYWAGLDRSPLRRGKK